MSDTDEILAYYRDGQSAPWIAGMLDIPVSRVRRVIKEHKANAPGSYQEVRTLKLIETSSVLRALNHLNKKFWLDNVDEKGRHFAAGTITENDIFVIQCAIKALKGE